MVWVAISILLPPLVAVTFWAVVSDHMRRALEDEHRRDLVYTVHCVAQIQQRQKDLERRNKRILGGLTEGHPDRAPIETQQCEIVRQRIELERAVAGFPHEEQ